MLNHYEEKKTNSDEGWQVHNNAAHSESPKGRYGN